MPSGDQNRAIQVGLAALVNEKMAGTTVALFLVMFAETAIACEQNTCFIPYACSTIHCEDHSATAIPVYIAYYNIDQPE